MVREHLVCGTLALAVLLFNFAGAETPKPIPPALSLDDQPSFERELAPGEVHAYELSLSAGDFVRLSVDPAEFDVLVTLESPTGEPLVSRLRRNLIEPATTLSTIAKAGGRHRLVVESKWPTSSRYVVRIVERRPTIAADRDRIDAERAYSEGVELSTNGTAESIPAAMVAFERALGLFRKLRDDAATADALDAVGTVHMFLGDYPKSLAPFVQSLALRQCLPDLFPRGVSLDVIGYVYNTLGERRKAITFLEAALLAKDPDLPRQAAFTLNSLALTYLEIGETETALGYYLQVLPMWRTAGDRLGEATVLHSIGALRARRGEWQEALDYAHQALRIWREQSHRDGQASTTLSLGVYYETRGEPERALSHYEKSLALFREMGDRHGQAHALRRIGDAHQALGNLDQAIEHHQQALKLFRETEHRSLEGDVLLGLGRSYAKRRDLPKALQYYSEALSISRSAERRGGEALVLKAMAEAQLETGNVADARASATQALELFRVVNYRPGEPATLLVRARAWEAAGDLAAARTDVESALRLTEQLRGNITTHEARALFLASVAEVSEFYIRLLMRLHEKNPDQGFDVLALRASEQARARSLVDLLVESRAVAGERAGRPGIERIRSLRERISAKAQAQLKLGITNSVQAAELARELEELNGQYEQVVAQIRRDDPVLAAVASPEPLDLAQIQHEVVDSSSALLEYSLGEARSFLWVVTPDKLFSYELPPRAQIESAVRAAYQTLSIPSGSVADLVPVSNLILAPARAVLRSKRLIVVPDGALQYVPFAALPSPATGRPLVADHEIVTLPSASTIAVLRQHPRPRQSSKVLAVFADPVFEKTDSRLTAQTENVPAVVASRGVDDDEVESEWERSARESGLASLPRLPFTRREATAVLSLVPPAQRKEALDFDANRRAVMDPEVGTYRFVHFATHGLLNTFHPELSGIVLSMVDEKGREQDGFLSTADVFNLSLGADLVVLSGCRTGLGKEIRGEGIAGLTRAFMYAGAPRVVASLWNVNDAATAELMKRFYQEMLGPGRLSPPAALRAAQLKIRKEARWSAPYYWAAFVIQGEWR